MIDILLVDDEPAARMAFRDLLSRKTQGYRVAGAVANGREALDFLAHRPADIVVTDLKMPVMNGLELIHRLKDTGFGGVILVMSNYSDFDLVREALLSGAQDYLLKVNMDGRSLQEHLDRACQTLVEKSASSLPARPDRSSARYREGALYDFLLGEPDQQTLEYLRGVLLESPPYSLFLVSPRKKKERKAVPEHSARSVLRSVLGVADILRMADGEYLCLAKLPEDGAAERCAARAEQITRQFHMYLNCPCGVVCSQPFSGCGQMKREYELCVQTMRLLFYQPLPAWRSAAPCSPAPLRDAADPETAAQALTERFILAGLEGVRGMIDDFVRRCAEDEVDPKALCSYAYALVQVLILSDPVRATTFAFSRHAALLNASSADELKQLLEELLPALLEGGVLSRYAGGNQDVKAVMLYLQYHYNRKVTLEEIAASVNLDKSYLCRLFKKETGQSIFQYLTAQRMERAAEMIEKGNVYVREAAAAVGIEDQFYFTRLFKKQFGVSPSEYRGGRSAPAKEAKEDDDP